MRRLGELCSKAVTLFLLDQTAAAEEAARTALENRNTDDHLCDRVDLPLTDDAKVIIAYLRRVGSASPTEISQYTELSRTTVFRRLRELVRRGLISKSGNTKSARYGLVAEKSCVMPTPTTPTVVQVARMDNP